MDAPAPYLTVDERTEVGRAARKRAPRSTTGHWRPAAARPPTRLTLRAADCGAGRGLGMKPQMHTDSGPALGALEAVDGAISKIEMHHEDAKAQSNTKNICLCEPLCLSVFMAKIKGSYI